MKSWWFVPAAALLLAACDRESPLEVGQGLLPPGAVQTFEVILDPSRYLAQDTAFGLYTDPRDAPFLALAREFDDALNANAVLRFNVPQLVTLPNVEGVSYVDTIPNFFTGFVRVPIDSLTVPDEPIQIALYHTMDDWHSSATWTLRIDTIGNQSPWTNPGAMGGDLISRITLPAGTDTIQLPVDSLAIERWLEIAEGTRGAVIVIETPGVRLRTRIPELHLQGRPSQRPDTIVDAVGFVSTATYIYEPELPASAGEPRVGGTPAWRTIYTLQPRLDTLTFECPGVPGCRISLADASINYAAMMLQPVEVPFGFRPEADLNLVAYLLFPTPEVPLQRSPLGDVAGIATVPAETFDAPYEAPSVQIQLTDLIRLASLNPAIRGEQYLPTHFTVAPAGQTFGFGAFESMPRLRLVLSIARELVLP